MADLDEAVLDEDVISSLAERLELFAESLPPQDRSALETLILRAMDPIARMELRDVSTLLNEREIAVMRALEARAKGE